MRTFLTASSRRPDMMNKLLQSISLSRFCYSVVCEELELANSKMASVEEIRTRVSLQEHDVINVSLVFVSWYIAFLIHYF